MSFSHYGELIFIVHLIVENVEAARKQEGEQGNGARLIPKQQSEIMLSGSKRIQKE